MKNLIILIAFFSTISATNAQMGIIENCSGCPVIAKLGNFENCVPMFSSGNTWLPIPSCSTSPVLISSNGDKFTVAYVAESLSQGQYCFDGNVVANWTNCNTPAPIYNSVACCANNLTVVITGPPSFVTVSIY